MIGIVLIALKFIPGFGKIQERLQKIIALGIIILLISLSIGYVTKRIYNSGKQAGRIEMSKRIVKDKEEEWAEREKAIEVYKKEQEQEINAKRAELDEQLSKIARLPYETRSALDGLIRNLNKEREVRYENVDSIPTSELWGNIRRLSDELEHAPNRERATAGSVPIE